ncbi:MAG: hypothetical protein ACI4HQ_06050 [Acetatifactor sp.]
MVGQFTFSRAGHDKGTLFVIVREEEDFVYLSDGRLKKPDAPKKKRRKHLQPVNLTVEEPLREKLLKGETVYPEEIRTAIRRYRESSQEK